MSRSVGAGCSVRDLSLLGATAPRVAPNIEEVAGCIAYDACCLRDIVLHLAGLRMAWCILTRMSSAECVILQRGMLSPADSWPDVQART